MQRRTGSSKPRKKAAQAALPPNQFGGLRDVRTPFAGVSKTGSPAKDKAIPHLTAQVDLAKARQLRVAQGGILSPEQRAAEQKAAQILAKPSPPARRIPVTPPKRSARKLQGLPATPPLVLGAPAPPPSAPASAPSSTLPPGRRGTTSPRAQLQAAQPKQGGLPVPGFVRSAAETVGNQVNASLHDPLSALLPPGVAPALHQVGINVTSALGKGGQKAAKKIATAGEKTASINVNLLSPAQAKSFPGQKSVTEEQIKELEAQKGGLGGLPKATRHTLIEGAVNNGWPREDVIKLVDSDLIHAYGNKPASPVIQFVKNAGGFAATQAAAPAGFVALGDAAVQAATGNTTPLKKQAQQFVEGSTVGVPFLSQHGALHDWYWRPGESATNLSFGVGAADRLLGKASKFAPGVAREVTPEGFTKPVSRGELSTKPIQRGIEKARDAYVNAQNPVLNATIGENPLLGPLSPVARRTAVAKQAYQATRERSVAPTMAEANQLRANVMRAANKVGPERASALNAHLQGADAARAPFYRQVSQELGLVKGRGAKAHAKLSEKHPITEATMTPKDREYVQAVRAAAQYSTKTRAGAGQLSQDLSGRYRAYQLPIVSAAKTGDELAIRTQALHNQWTNGLAKKLPPEELQPIADQFHQALDAFTQRHADQGGTTPVYIPQEVPQTLTNAYRREASVTATSKVPKLKATQDKLISSGQYRTTPSGVSLETHRAAVVRSRIDHFNAVNDEYATKAENGGPADPNVVYVKAENLRSPVKLENTVGEHNLTDEQVHSTLDQMRMALEQGRVDTTGGYIPAHGDIRAIPKTIYDELHSSTVLPKGAKIGQVYDTLNRKYLRLMLSKPSTGVANFVGNPILAAMGGAGPFDIAKGYGIVRNAPDTLPPQLLGEGLGGAAGQRIAHTPIGKYINFSLSHQRAAEDAARASLYHHNSAPYVRKQMKLTGDSAEAVLKRMARGEDPHGAIFAKQVEDFLGKMRDRRNMNPGTEKFLSRSILFHRWLGHILTLTLYTMPVKYPGRAVLLQRISEIGDDYRKHHGVYPSWYLSMIPLMQHIATDAGVPEAFTRAIPTGSTWPTANLPLPLADAEGANPYAAVIGSTNPVVRAAVQAPTGMDWANLRPYRDAQGKDIGPGLNLGLLAGQEYRNLPYAGVVTPFPGLSADAYPGSMTPAVHKNKYGKPLPAGFGTSSRPYGGSTPALTPEYAIGALSRLFLGGSGLQDLPAQTRGTNYARVAQQVKARQGRNRIIRERAKARAKKKG